MKKAAILILALLVAFALVGCNVAPNIPSVTPYTTARVTPYTTARVSPYTTYGVTSSPITRVSPYATAPGNIPGYDTSKTYGSGYNGYDYYTAGTAR
jgi:hypothetical protein